MGGKHFEPIPAPSAGLGCLCVRTQLLGSLGPRTLAGGRGMPPGVQLRGLTVETSPSSMRNQLIVSVRPCSSRISWHFLKSALHEISKLMELGKQPDGLLSNGWCLLLYMLLPELHVATSSLQQSGPVLSKAPQDLIPGCGHGHLDSNEIFVPRLLGIWQIILFRDSISKSTQEFMLFIPTKAYLSSI